MADTADLKAVVVRGDPLLNPYVFTVEVTNLGPDTGRNPQLTVILISESSFTVVSASATGNNPDVQPAFPVTGTILILLFQWDDIPAGETFVCTVEVSQDFTEPTNVQVVGDIIADSTDPDSSNNQHEVTVTLAMAFDPTALFDSLESKLAASGWMTGQIAEPMSPPSERLGAVIFDGVEITELSLATGTGIVKFIIRLYYNAMEEPREDTEKDIARAVLQTMDDICGQYTLGDGSVRNVVPLSLIAKAGFQEVGGAMYRLTDLPVNVLVNDIVTFAA